MDYRVWVDSGIMEYGVWGDSGTKENMVWGDLGIIYSNIGFAPVPGPWNMSFGVKKGS
jgi:hypothetical protein